MTSVAAAEAPLLEVEHLRVHYAVKGGNVLGSKRGFVSALEDVSLALNRGETLGIVGESGCGKSTLARCLIGLVRPTAGSIRFNSVEVRHERQRDWRAVRREVQIVFQDPYGSLNPRRRVREIVADGFRARGTRGSGDRARVSEMLDLVGLGRTFERRFPHELSGGQRQRVSIARALAAGPSVLILDEPVSALDVSVQAQILNLLSRLQSELGLSYVFIGHDLAVVRHVADRIAVLYLGKVVESAATDDLFARPLHPYTRALIGAIPDIDEARREEDAIDAVVGESPSALNPPTGCRFHPRCPLESAVCVTDEPPLMELYPGQIAACHHPIGVDEERKQAATLSPLSPLSASTTSTATSAVA